MLKLILPSVKYKKEFHKFIRELIKEKRISKDDSEKILSQNFDEYVRKLCEQSKGLNLPKQFVPQTEYWLVDNKVLVGNLRIRHKLNKNLKNAGGHIGATIRPSERKRGYGKEALRLGLLKARILGLEKILITCDINNTASKKIIEANGGKFQNEFTDPKTKLHQLRYWIKIK